MKNLTPTQPAVPDFTPVPRKYRYDGWTAERQRGFIHALAETGSVKAACARINMSSEGAYYLRRQPGADEFRAAWTAALDHGVQRLTDIAIDRATEGVAIPIFHDGVQVGERRWFNDRLLMFILKHHIPHVYSPPQLKTGTQHVETLRREWENEQFMERHRRGEQATANIWRKIDAIRGHFLSGLVGDPAKRAAWDLIVGPTDWTAVDGWDGEAPTEFDGDNMTLPSTITTLAVQVGVGERMSDLMFARGGDEDEE
ncbi:hypothetical protein [Sphingomonas sp.]|jgi:hypothetical protein|uniref:hypothetical protein n=1 Tax=Sphingomonas sp. TaxID=28214 RepID=UPI002E303BA7|nr:hypothetical protein [Sphingomonas sp.]HEX4693168.1 hypothetical protein [Sphingomonas sp.]